MAIIDENPIARQQEVLMLRDRLKGYTVAEYRWVLLAKLMASCLFVLTVYVVVNMVAERPKPARADYSGAITGPAEGVKPAEVVAEDPLKAAVVRWMKDNSEMPDQVLSRIYETAVNNPHADLILAICMVESNFNPNAKSRKGAVGLMGIVSSVWLEELKKEGIVNSKRDLYLVSNNIASGVYVLKKYLSRSKDLEQALLDYVGGDNLYVGKVMQALGEVYLAKMLIVPQGKPAAAEEIASGFPPAGKKEALNMGEQMCRVVVD